MEKTYYLVHIYFGKKNEENRYTVYSNVYHHHSIGYFILRWYNIYHYNILKRNQLSPNKHNSHSSI